MARTLRGSAFLHTALSDESEVDPRTSLVNLVDVMLVFSCGLMVALLSYWNLDFSSVKLVKQDAMTEMSKVQELAEELTSGSGLYTQVGTVYQDPTSGKLYLVKGADGGSSSGSGEETAAPSATSRAQGAD
ncbi:MAG: DUF2149 domain-containing protein [Coriobacteriia bacterium]|nr:DUF2149 domain-containing protein [Coriobacteriia bacterium]